MKQDYIENQAKKQIQQSIKDALTGSSQTILRLKVIEPPVQNHPSMGGASGRFCKGPPGRSRSPGEADLLFPEHPPDHFTANENQIKTNLKPILNSIKVRSAEIHLNTESQIVIKTQFLQPFKFFIMKKQILFLAMFVLALFAGMNKSYGQENNYLDATPSVVNAVVTPLSCTSSIDEIHPQAGQEYTYSVTTAATNTVHWFVVANENNIVVDFNDITGVTGGNLIDDGLGGDEYIAASNGAYNNPATTSSSVNITWKSFDGLTEQVLLVAYVVDPATCSTNNIEVYRILPVFNFTLDVNAIASSGSETGKAGTDDAEECVSPIESATYTPSPTPLTVPGELVANYGENWVFFTVTAANFTHSWMPTFEITYTGNQGEVLAADWAYLADASANTDWNSINITTGVTTEVLHPGTVIGTSVGADDGTGEYIIVRVQVDHGVLPENAVNDQKVKMAVNGIMYDQVATGYTNTALEDLHFADTDVNGKCDDTDGFLNDWVEYVITPRPQIINNTGTTPSTINFETKEDNSDDQGNN